jgi:hypothetical protein
MQSDTLDDPVPALTQARTRASGEKLHLDAGYLSGLRHEQGMLALQQKSTGELEIGWWPINEVNGRLPYE